MDKSYYVRESAAVPSPSLFFYEEKIRRNIETALSIAGGPGRLRPHVKTHKTKEIVDLQLEYGIEKFKCATIAEAEMLAQCRVKDVILAYPLVGPNIERFLKLIEVYPQARFKAVIDSRAGAEKLSEAAVSRKIRVEVLIDIDPGLHRTGVEAGEAGMELYRGMAQLKGLVPVGIHCYDGQNHQPDKGERTRAARACYSEVMEFRERLKKFNLPAETVVLGGTPTFPLYAEFPEVELSPGTCFLQDWNYLSSYPDMDFACAALIFSRVISINTRESTFTLDLGYKSIASDPQGARGIILTRENARPVFQNEEHWVFHTAEKLPEIGEEMYVLPAHICPTCALYSEAFAIDAEGKRIANWEIIARRRKLSI
jgi:D-serine deaminase-like pyridoxal phosphate-dependent protein